MPSTNRRVRGLVITAAVGVMVLVAAACEPVKLGGPGPAVGNTVDPVACPQYQPVPTPPCGPQPQVWAAMNGPYATYNDGDPYSTKCAPGGGRGTTCTATNPLYRTTGYAYAIEVAAADVGRPLTLEAYDIGTYTRTVYTGSSPSVVADCSRATAPFNLTTYSAMNGMNCQTGDSASGDGEHIDVQVYEHGGTGEAAYDSVLPGCHFSQSATQMKQAIATYKNRWATMCTFTPAASGVYAVRIRNSGLPGMVDASSGYNAYALRVQGATSTSLYPLGEHSVYANVVGTTSVMYVADVPAANAGKRLVVDVYDPGDGAGYGASLKLKAPPGGTATTPGTAGVTIPAPGIATACRYNATPSPTPEPQATDTAPNCAVTTAVSSGSNSAGIYDGNWLRFEVDLDPAYTCSTDCRWTFHYNWWSNGLPTDRMVFTAKVVG